jgi:hypothetical protein
VGWYYFSDKLNDIWYAIKYGVKVNEVTVNKKPHNCDWDTAPMGNKNCHYEEEAQKIITGLSTDGKPIVSYDNGKSWQWDSLSNPSKPHVTIWWRKVED